MYEKGAEAMMKFDLPRDMKDLIESNGEEVRGYTPGHLLDVAEFYELEGSDPLRWVMPGKRFAITIGKKVYVMPGYMQKIMNTQWVHAPLVWHELVHVAQWLDKGALTFLFDYAWGTFKNLGDWKKTYLEKEAFEKEARFQGETSWYR